LVDLSTKISTEFYKEDSRPWKEEALHFFGLQRRRDRKTHFNKIPSWLSFYDLKQELEITSETQMF
jgi:hypothetical protein